MGRGRLADGDELVDMLVQPGLLAVQRGSVHDRLGQRSAAAQAHARERAAAAAAEARRAVAVGDPDRAEQPKVVEMEQCPRARGLGRGERAPPQRRMDVVGVHDLRAQPAYRAANRVGIESPAEQAERRLPASERVARALEHLDLVPAAAEQRGDLGDRALLASGGPVAVVEEQDHARIARQRADAAFWMSTAAPTTGGPSSDPAVAASCALVRLRDGSIEKRPTT